jgi:hypothetical protein
VPRTSARTNWDAYVWDEASAAGILWRWNKASSTTNWERLAPGLGSGVNYPTPREGACLVWSGVNSNDHGTDNPQLLLYGGVTSSGVHTSEINEYDIVSNTWTLSAIYPGPSARAWAGCGRIWDDNGGTKSYDGLIMWGGEDGRFNYNELWIFCANTGQSGTQNDCPQHPRSWIYEGLFGPSARNAMVLSECTIWQQTRCWILWGGNDGSYRSDAYIFEAGTDGFFSFHGLSQTGGIPSARNRAGAAVGGDPRSGSCGPFPEHAGAGLMLYGGENSGGALGDMWYGIFCGGGVNTLDWSQVSSNAPGARDTPVLGCLNYGSIFTAHGCFDNAGSDAFHDYFILYGGFNGGTSYSSTWRDYATLS